MVAFPLFVEGSSDGHGRAIDNPPDSASDASLSEMEEDQPQIYEDNGVFVQEFPVQPETYGEEKTCWERMCDERLPNPAERWGGFADEEEWELARWLVSEGVSQSAIDRFLKLPIVSSASHGEAH